MLVKNLADKPIYLSDQKTLGKNMELVEISENGSIEYSILLNKLELSVIDTTFSITMLVNESLKLMISFSKTEGVYFPLKLSSQDLFWSNKNVIFKCPIVFVAKLDSSTESEKFDAPNLKSIMLIGLIQNTESLPHSEYEYKINLNKRLNSVFYSDSFSWTLKVMLSVQ